MFPVSGPGFFAPPPRARGAAPKAKAESLKPSYDEPLAIDEDPRKISRLLLPSLIHPGTSELFRSPLEPILAQLPPQLLGVIIEEGYCLHVVDTQGRQALTLEVDEPDTQELEAYRFERPRQALDIARERGAATPEEEEAYAELVMQLNPSHAEGWLPAGTDVLVPAFRYWRGLRLASGGEQTAWEFLTQPLRSFVAGMVTHGQIEGLRGEANRIVFWDCAFERGDGLLDWYVLHELGHTTDYAFAFRKPDAWREWRVRVEQAYQRATQGELITRYAGESPHEYLAEGFAAFWREEWSQTNPEFGDLAIRRAALNQAALQALDPVLYRLLEEAIQTVI